MKLEFNPNDLKRGLAMAKLVKPMPTSNYFILKVMGGNLVIYSFDKRRSVRAEVIPSKPIDQTYESDEYFLPVDKQSFLDSELTAVSLTISDKNISIKTESENQSRQATIKKKSELSRTPPIPIRPNFVAAATLQAHDFEELLRQVSCSAMIRETKTEEDMRINQVHFYSEHECAVANARFYATEASLPGLNIDLSLVSADLPLMKSFCSKLHDQPIKIGQTDKHLFLIDPNNSYIMFSRVVSTKPAYKNIPVDGHEIVLSIDRNQFIKCLTWASMAIDGTQRLTLSANNSDNIIEFHNGKQELGKMPVQFIIGNRFSADFPVKYLAGIVKYLGDGNAYLKYAHPELSTILEITEQIQDGTSKARHFIQAMNERS
jgi:hypothetical protein